MTTESFNEPWTIRQDNMGLEQIQDSRDFIDGTALMPAVTRARIVACVNFCAGASSEDLTNGKRAIVAVEPPFIEPQNITLKDYVRRTPYMPGQQPPPEECVQERVEYHRLAIPVPVLEALREYIDAKVEDRPPSGCPFDHHWKVVLAANEVKP